MYISRSPAETEGLGERWGREAVPGQVIALNGELGAGKTQLVKGLARGLGCPAGVHSPSFTIVNVYEQGRLPLFHLDLFRLDTAEALASAGIEDYLRSDAVTVIEWAERLGDQAMRGTDRGRTRLVRIEILDDNTRRVLYEDSGS